MAKYTPKDYAQIIVSWEANGRNIKRTAKQIDVPVSTVRSITQRYERDPSAYDLELVEEVVSEELDRALQIRNAADEQVFNNIHKASPYQAAGIAKLYAERADRIQGIRDPSGDQVVRLELPDVREALTAAFLKSADEHTQRQKVLGELAHGVIEGSVVEETTDKENT